MDFIAGGSFVLPLALKSQSQLTITKIRLHMRKEKLILSLMHITKYNSNALSL